MTRLVTGVAANSYYRLLGNQSKVSINWMKTCVTEGGSGGAGNELTPVTEFPLGAAAGTVVALASGDTYGIYQYDGTNWNEAGAEVDLSAYWTSAQTQSAITAVEDHLFDVEQVTASALTELHDGLLEVSARTVDLSNYWTSAETQEAIDEAISGITPADPTILKSVSELNSAATFGDVQSKTGKAQALPEGVTFETGNTYGEYEDLPGGTLTIPVGFAAGTTAQNPIELLRFVFNTGESVDPEEFVVKAYEDANNKGGVVLLIMDTANTKTIYMHPEAVPDTQDMYYYNYDYPGTDRDENNMMIDIYESEQSFVPLVFTIPEKDVYEGLYIKTEDGWKNINDTIEMNVLKSINDDDFWNSLGNGKYKTGDVVSAFWKGEEKEDIDFNKDIDWDDAGVRGTAEWLNFENDGNYEINSFDNSFDYVPSGEDVPEFPTKLDFWFGTSKVYGEGESYHVFYDENAEELVITSATGEKTDWVISVEKNEVWITDEDDEYTYFRIVYNVEEDIKVDGDLYNMSYYGVSNESVDAGFYHITKFNDAGDYYGFKYDYPVEHAGPYVVVNENAGEAASLINESQMNNAFSDFSNNLNYNYYYKWEVNNLISAATSGSSTDLSGYWTSAQTKNYVDTEVGSVRTDIQTLSGKSNDMQTDIQTLSGKTDATILRGTELPENPEVGDVVSKVHRGHEFVWDYSDGTTTAKMPIILDELNQKDASWPWNDEYVYEIATFMVLNPWEQVDKEVGASVWLCYKKEADAWYLGVEHAGFFITSGYIGNNVDLLWNIPISGGYNATVKFTYDDIQSYPPRMIQIGRTVEGEWSGSVRDIPGWHGRDFTASDIAEGAVIYNGSEWESITKNTVSSTAVSTIWKGTQAEYDAETTSGATADPTTLYIII